MSKPTKSRQIIQEKFGFTSNLPNNTERLHDDVTERNGKGGKNPAYLPVEQFRKQIKLLMGATTTEEDGVLEDVLDARVLRRVLEKTSTIDGAEDDLQALELGFEKKDKSLISAAWARLQDKIPYWVLGMLGQYAGPGDAAKVGNEDLPENDKEALSNFIELMNTFNADGEKHGKEAAENTPKSDGKTGAEKNLDKAKKEAGI